MNNDENQAVRVPYQNLSANPEAQREAIAASRQSGAFNGCAHLAASPIGLAVANGLPLAKRKI